MRGASRALPAPRSGPGEPGNEPISTGRERFTIRRFAGLEGIYIALNGTGVTRKYLHFYSVLFSSAVLAKCTKQNNNIALFGAKGNFSSPFYPSKYPPERKCHWTISAPKEHFVHLTFVKFRTKCPDGVVIRDIDAKGQQLGEHCGSLVPPDYRGRQLSLEFISDSKMYKDEDGFQVIYEMVPCKCCPCL